MFTIVIYRVFTAVVKFIATEVRKLGILAIFYIDDILTLGKDAEECEKAVGRLLNILKARGFVINYKKSDLSPTKIFTYLGHVWNAETMMVSLKPQREVKINEVVKSVKEISDGDMEDLEDDESDTEEEKSDEEIIDGQMKDFGRR